MVSGTKQSHVRVSPETHALLRELAEETGDSMTALVERAVENYRRELLFDAAERDYRELEADPEALADFEAEVALWDTTSSDGLEREEW